jgi:hypothetical protein
MNKQELDKHFFFRIDAPAIIQQKAKHSGRLASSPIKTNRIAEVRLQSILL